MAKTSAVAICNYALSLLGENSIISLDDDSKPAALCKVMYPQVRDATIEAHNWTFAVRWYEIPKAAAASDGPLKNRFPMPPEILRVIFVGVDAHHTEEYQIEGEDIVTNSQTCVVKAVILIEDTFKFSSLFSQALSAKLAAELAVPIAASASLSQQMYQLYGVKIQEAVTRDQIQGTTRRITAKWINRSRFTGTRFAGPTV